VSRVVRPLRVVVVAPARYPLRQPHAGGLEACVWDRVRWLRGRGHEVTLIAAEGSDGLGPEEEFHLPVPRWTRSEDASDTLYPAGYARTLDDAMNRALARLRAERHRFDVIDNHSLHAAPVRWSAAADIPVLTTLHTPPLPDLVDAAADTRAARHRFVAVSQHTARAWSAQGVEAFVFPNGVDTDRWRPGPGGTDWVWFGRVVPEKAPHLAIDAARAAGARLVLAGRVGDAEYFRREIRPRLGGGVRYAGAMRQPQLSRLVGASAVALVTPVWDEPFGLVIAEALATGTPVAAFDGGGVPEVLAGMPAAAVVAQHEVAALAEAATALAARTAADPALRAAVRRAAVERYSLAGRYREIERVLAFTAAQVAPAEAPAVGQW
jgi:glycosyltransferase involved in cell wall biosynthesis